MRRGAAFGLLFLFVFTVTLAARLPLRWALPFLPASLHCAQPEGSLWSGSCQGLALTPSGLNFEAVGWDWRPSRLLRGRLSFEVRIRRHDSMASGLLQLAPGRIEILDVTGSGNIEPGLPPPLAGWSGRLVAEGLRARFVGGRLDSLDGRLDAHELRSPQGIAWGSYRIEIPRSEGKAPTGKLVSLDGPLRLQGTVAVKPVERSWQLDVRVAVQPGADPALERALGALGPADAQGLRPLSVAGAY